MWLVTSKVVGIIVMVVSTVSAGTWPNTHRYEISAQSSSSLLIVLQMGQEPFQNTLSNILC
jgi:hypothetical protein